MADVGRLFASTLPYLLMTGYYLSVAFLILFHQIVIIDGVSATVIAVYEQVVAAVFLCCLAFFIERGKRPPFSLHFLSWAFFIGTLQIPLGQILLTVSLRYIDATFQTVAINMIPAVVFVITIFTGQETFKFGTPFGQAKLLSIIASTVGAILLVFFTDPGASDSGSVTTGGGRWLGCTLVAVAVLSYAVSPVLLEGVATRYEPDVTLSATMTVFGTIQALIIAAFVERKDPSSWKITWSYSMQLFTILYGGLVTMGLGYFAANWCVSTKGPLFASAFSPLLIVFSFLLQTLIFGADASPSSIVTALLVVCSLYLLLWAKSKDHAKNDQNSSSDSCRVEPLLVNTI